MVHCRALQVYKDQEGSMDLVDQKVFLVNEDQSDMGNVDLRATEESLDQEVTVESLVDQV